MGREPPLNEELTDLSINRSISFRIRQTPESNKTVVFVNYSKTLKNSLDSAQNKCKKLV